VVSPEVSVRVVGFAVIVAASLVFVQHPSAQAQNAAVDTSTRRILIVQEARAPLTLKALADKSDAIVRGRVRSIGDLSEALIGATTPLAVHFDTLEVLETMKSSSNARSLAGMRVMQFGGKIESPGGQVETRNSFAIGFKPDEEVIVFVRKHPLVDAYVLASSPISAFEVAAESRFVSLPEKARALPEFDGRTWMPLGEFRSILQDAF
jgi:hypothetical protein